MSTKRKTYSAEFKAKDLNLWLKKIRNQFQTQEWLKILKLKNFKGIMNTMGLVKTTLVF